MVTVYFDCCSLRRLTDDQSQPRVRAEADAVEQLLSMVEARKVDWISSEALILEVSRTSSEAGRRDGLALLRLATRTLQANDTTWRRAGGLASSGYGRMDALHLAFAEQAGTDFLFTTDDRFLRKAMRLIGQPRVRVENPVNWLREVTQWLP